jgi:phospholipid/cholesterol/gamma-HCH transport system substrate-binding protein
VNRTLLRDFFTGLTALAGLVGLVFVLILFGEMTGVAERNYPFKVTISNAAGLAETSPVTIDGVRVGRVTKLEAVQGVGARVHVLVKQGVRIPRKAAVSIDRGFVGDSSMEFQTVGLSQADLADVIQPDDVVDGGSPQTLLGTVQELVKGPVERLTTTAEKIEELAAEYKRLGEQLNDLMEPRTLADVQAGKAPNLRSTMERLDKAIANADAWLGDSEFRGSAKDLVARANRVIDQAGELTIAWTKTAQTVEGTVKNVEGQAQQVSDEFRQLSTKAQDVLTRAQDAASQFANTMEKINNGQGTAGRLLNDPELYENLNDAASRLDRALLEAQQLIEKYKAEGIRLKL